MARKPSSEKAFLSGNEALARGAWQAGLKVACAYPGTPSTQILESLAEYPEVDVQWSVNEKTAFEVAYAAAVGGVRALFACKHVGLNVAMDPLMTSAYTGVNAGFVAVVCDDPQMHSSQNEQDTRWAGVYAKLPILEPSSPSEALDFIQQAFDISEQYDTPVIVRMTTRVCHSKEDVPCGGPRKEMPVRPLERNMRKYVMVPANARARHEELEKRLLKLKALSERSRLNRVEMNSPSLGFIADSVSYLYLKEVFPDASYLKLGFLYPFCDEKIRKFAKSVKRLMVVEELDPFIEEHVRALGIRKVQGKHPSYRLGELDQDLVRSLVAGKPKKVKPRPGRAPRLCAGCPHWSIFSVLKKLDVFVAGDIGCYTLGSLPPTSALHTCLCMGAGVTFNEGLRRAHPEEKIVGLVGDSTFVHMGIPGLINAAYNKAKGIIFILDNSTTAMTGGQQHPATGKTIRNEPTKRLDLKAVCQACGADYVDVIDPQGRVKELEELVKQRLAADALSVIIVQHPCVLLK
ncbi:MAG: thiamine pyrophosphate-dependent enzyme [Anaerohalosphaeraceae bacterium]